MNNSDGNSNISTKLTTTDELFVKTSANRNDLAVTYLITTSLAPEKAAIKLCKEQSLSPTLGNDPMVIEKYSAKYVPSSIHKISNNQFAVDLIFPEANCENSLSMILSAIGGDTYNLKNLYPIKVLRVKLPDSIIDSYPGPRYGVQGIREMLNCPNRPLLCGPVKPCVGLHPKAFARRAYEALIGGADLVKDDELICDPDYSSLETRVRVVVEAVKRARTETGLHKLYFAFIGSGSPARIMRRAAIAMDHGADGIMISPAINGWEIIRDLREQFTCPIIAHNAYAYSAFTKNHGLAFDIFAQFQRLCGADFVVTPAKYGSFDVLTEEEQRADITALLGELGDIKTALPAFCGGQSSSTIERLRNAVGSNDFMVITGTALYDHPDGPTVGARLLRETLENI